jgi:copper transport protein
VGAWAALLLALVLLAAATPAQAHGYIVRSIPEDRAALERAPVRVQYWFSEELEPEFSSITVRNQVGEVLTTGGVSPDDYSLLEARLPTNLADGAYTSELRIAFASDGHVVVESRVFFVGEADGGVSGFAASDQPVILEVIWRALVFWSLTLLMGAFALYNLVLLPAWGSADYPAGHLPPRVVDRLNQIVIVALVVTFGSHILALLQQTMVFFGADAGRVLQEGLWQVVRSGTRFGDTWNMRMGLLALVAVLHGASLYLRQRQPEAVRAFWAANVWVMALCLGTLSIASHAAGSLLLPWMAIFSDWMHLLAVGFWAGGLAALVLILPVALRPYSGEARRRALVAALKRFSVVAAAGLVVVSATGLYNTLNWLNAPSDLGSSYGGALIVKLLLVGLLLLVGAGHFIALRPECYARWSGIIRRVNSFIPTLRLEAGFVLLVLAATAFLSATPVPKVEIEAPPPPAATQNFGDYTVTTTITPGGTGVNTYDTVIRQAEQPIDGLLVYLRLVNPARDWRGTWHAAENVGDGLYVAAGDDINQPGNWLTVVEIGAGESAQRAAFQWNISADAGVIEARASNLLNVIALLGVLAALGFAAYPLLRRFYQRLDLSGSSLTVAAATVVVTVVVVLAVALAIQQGTAEYDLTVNPPPEIVNAVIPDGPSLARGQTLLAAQCGGWQTAADWNELTRRLARVRDEELFAYTLNGWRTLPPCNESLIDSQRWDVVNYVRSFEPKQ